MLLVGLSACDSTDSNDDPGDMPPETASVTVGESNLELNAFFAEGEDPETGEQGFVIYLTELDNLDSSSQFATSSGAFMGTQGSRPSPGTYTFADLSLEDEDDDLLQNQFGFVFWEIGGEGFPSQIVVSNSGDLNITTSTSDLVAGSFEIDATAGSFKGEGFSEEEITVTGDFNAGQVDVLITDVEF